MELAKDGKEPGRYHNNDELVSRPNECREAAKILRASKHIAVHLLPAAVLTHTVEALKVVVIPHVTRIVVPEGAQQDEAHQATQEYNHHETVEDAEPVDLVLKEVVIKVSLEASREGLGRRNPLDRV